MALLNLIIGLLVNAIQEQHVLKYNALKAKEIKNKEKTLLEAVEDLNKEVQFIRQTVIKIEGKDK